MHNLVFLIRDHLVYICGRTFLVLINVFAVFCCHICRCEYNFIDTKHIPLNSAFVFSNHRNKLPYHAGYSPLWPVSKRWTSLTNYITRIRIFEVP